MTHYEAMDRTEYVKGRTKPYAHVWVTLVAWTMSEEKLRDGGSVYMDQENIMSITEPGCYKCEQPYSPEIAEKPCYGSWT